MTIHNFLSNRAIALKPSLTLEISARAKALKKEGRDICSLSAGEPDFDTPNFIVEAAIKALKDGITRYGPVAGDPELREAIARKITIINNVPTKSSEVLVTNGGKQAIYNLLQVILNQDDEVIIPSPYWLSYPEIVTLAGGKPVILDSLAKDGFKLDLDKLEHLINQKTKLLILNTPSNPTGRVISKAELEGVAEILRRNHQVLVLSDEIYEFLINKDETHYSMASIAEDLKERIFTVNGFAKAWAMTGWRIGYLSGNQEIITSASALQSQSTSNVCSFAQRGALAALNGSMDCVRKMTESYNERRKLMSSELEKIKGINLVKPTGAFYAFPQLDSIKIDSVEFCKQALEDYDLALVPGDPFGNKKCVRLSCAVSIPTLQEGIKRLESIIINKKH